MTYLLPYANIDWLNPHTPYSPMFDDIYWSQSDDGEISALSEKTHVFIEGNQLKQRWSHLYSQHEFTILETGFGFGLNFILCAEQKQLLNEEFTLHYVAFEQYPVSPDDLIALNDIIKNHWLEKLIKHYPQPIPGTHHIWLSEKICLTLIFGDITATLPMLEAKVDACFLDGFSPSKNELMWQSDMFSQIKRCLRPGGSCSSYSVAGHVRRALKAEELIVTKEPGFGKKAEMLKVLATGNWVAKEKTRKKIAIVGAGLSGLFCAQAFKKRGIACTVLETDSEALGAVKDFSQLAIYPQLSATPQKYSLFSLHAFSFLVSHATYHQSGRLQILNSAEETAKAEKLLSYFPSDFLRLVDANEATQIAGFEIDKQALYLPLSGWLDPRDISVKLPIQFDTKISKIEKVDSAWVLSSDDGPSIESDIVILTTGSNPFSSLDALKLVPVRGQSLQIPLPADEVNTIVEGKVSLFPRHEGLNTLSATFTRDDPETDPRLEDSTFLLEQLSTLINPKTETAGTSNEGKVALMQMTQEIKVQVGHRMTTRDRMPVCGELPNWDALEKYCKSPQRDRQKIFTDYQHQLYCSVGFGSHGATLSPYCSELLAREINDEPRSRDNTLVSALRFAFRDSGTKFGLA
ncbi:MAG: tRNA 5-methylaminomethyl-2-thiouridine biosynthesis bifunctional protein [Candidatus Azotimanducaceae bacterium]|jgi:tRNA 5-methylaminomethyl-2-thiouridine biosynthesis bifunctional protein